MARVEPQKFKVGDRVKWTGQANGGRVEHVGIIKRIYLAGSDGGRVEHVGIIKRIYLAGSGGGIRQQFDQAKVEVASVNKRTGKPNKPKVYMPRLSALTLVKE